MFVSPPNSTWCFILTVLLYLNTGFLEHCASLNHLLYRAVYCICAFIRTGLSRLEKIYREILRKTIFIEIESLYIADVTECYMALRNLDQRQPVGNKYIVLDISTIPRLQKVLYQVRLLYNVQLSFAISRLIILLYVISWERHSTVNLNGVNFQNLKTDFAIL